MENVIKLYIRDEKNKPFGVAVAVRKENEVHYGFSLINAKFDKWNSDHGTMIALKRAEAEAYQLPNVQERYDTVIKAYTILEKRAMRYFKDIDPAGVEFISRLSNE